VRTTGSFSREVEGDIQHVPGHFTSHPQHVSRACEYDFEQLLNELKLTIHNFNARGSNFVLDAVTQFVVVITQFRPLGGSTYILTPPSIAKKKVVINIQNEDNRCFEWSVLSSLYPAESNPHRVNNYSKYQNALNFDGIDFPVQVKQIPKFETQNPDISVNVISLDSDNKGFCVEYLSNERNRISRESPYRSPRLSPLSLRVHKKLFSLGLRSNEI